LSKNLLTTQSAIIKRIYCARNRKLTIYLDDEFLHLDNNGNVILFCAFQQNCR